MNSACSKLSLGNVIKFAAFILLLVAGCSSPQKGTAISHYVPDMSCNDVAGFAQHVAAQRLQGVRFEDQRDAIDDNYSDNPEAVKALKGIVRAIYLEADLRNETPAAIGDSYRRACTLMSRN